MFLVSGTDRANTQKYQLLLLVQSYLLSHEWIPVTAESLDVTRL